MILESRYGADGVRDLDLFIAKAQVPLVPVDEEQADLARRAFRKYGKGRHPAGLNFGDCFSYALSKALEAPLLRSGRDSARGRHAAKILSESPGERGRSAISICPVLTDPA